MPLRHQGILPYFTSYALTASGALYSTMLKPNQAKTGQDGLNISLQRIQPPRGTFSCANPEPKQAWGGLDGPAGPDVIQTWLCLFSLL